MSILDKLHTDLPWPFSLFKRGANAISDPNPPTEVYFSKNFDKEHKNPDVPNNGAWALSIHPKYGFCFAAVEDGWLFSIGTFRYDYVDKYYTFPRLAVKHIKT